MPISFLILTYNSSSYIFPFFDSLLKNIAGRLQEDTCELIIVDNASSDGSIHKINEYFKNRKEVKITFVKNRTNLGYAKGINLAAQLATGDILVVVNPDSVLLEADFGLLANEFLEKDSMAVAGLRMVDTLGINEKTAGKFYNPFTFFLFACGLENLFGLRFSPERIKKVDYVSGGFVAFNSEAFEKLGGYDEDYFMYVEDMDLCYRAKKAGFDTLYVPIATIRHAGQGSSSREFAIVNIYKGLQLFFIKHGSFLFLQYVKNLLSLKAALIIFIGSIFGKKDLVTTYKKALKTI